MKLSLPWLWLLSSFLWSACSWSCQSWEESRKGFWEALEARRPWRPQAPLDFLDFNCPPAAVTVLAFQLLADLEAGDGLSQDRLLQLEELLRHAFAFESLESLAAMLCSGFPVFGVLDWLAEILSDSVDGGLADCPGVRADQFHKALHHHVPPRPRGGRLSGPLPMPLPMAAALDFLLATRGQGGCGVGRAAATLALALAELRPVGGNETCQDLGLGSAAEAAQPASAALPLFVLLAKAQRLLLEEEGSLALRLLHRRWLPARLLHGLSRLLLPAWDSEQEPSEDCLILIYTFPTEEIRRDVRKALASLQSNYVEALSLGSGSRRAPRLVVFVDADSERLLEADLRPFTSLEIQAALIPETELRRPMPSYSCQQGEFCVSGDAEMELQVEAHRAKVNGTQYWSPTYLRISRYTAGPLFLHPALDSCRHFLKIDTDFFFTQALERDPFLHMKESGLRLGYWQIHVQGQRQENYMQASLAFLEEQQLRIRNRRFDARGRFEEKARKLQISLESVPVALQASTVLYGCLFGGDTRFFREPLYQSFFEYMDRQRGFERYGWSNQFFLGTAAAAFLAPSEVSRLYVSGVHQESSINVSGSELTEFLLGASHSFMR